MLQQKHAEELKRIHSSLEKIQWAIEGLSVCTAGTDEAAHHLSPVMDIIAERLAQEVQSLFKAGEV